ncbi:MAG: META domain-containing protein [Acidimicrobiales bacterium]
MTRESTSHEPAIRERFQQLAAALPAVERPMPSAADVGSLGPPAPHSGRRGRRLATAVALGAVIVAGAFIVASGPDQRRVETVRPIEADEQEEEAAAEALPNGGVRPATMDDLAGHVYLFTAARDLSTGADRALIGEERLWVSFFDDGTLGGTTGCHQFGGTYRIDGDGTLRYQPGFFGDSDLLYACDDSRGAQEQWITGLFRTNPALTIDNGVLTIGSADSALIATGIEGRFEEATLHCTASEGRVQGESDYFTQRRPEWSPGAAVADFLAARRTPALALAPLHEARTIPAAADSTSMVGIVDERPVLVLRLRAAGGTWTVTGWKACTRPGAILPTDAPVEESRLFTNAAIEADPRLRMTGTLIVDGAPPGCLLLETDGGRYLIRWPDGARRDFFNPDAALLPDGASFSAGRTLTLDGALLSSPHSYPFTQLVMAQDCGTESTIVRPLRITAQG